MSTVDDLKFVVGWLIRECRDKGYRVLLDALDYQDDRELFQVYRNLVNTREPTEASPEFLEAQDRVLQALIRDAGVTDASALPRVPADSRISLWRGDITTLKVDAIVNAANSQMLGCWVPGHYCIDNAIHTFAGVQLRLECDRLMRVQGHEEPTGMAKVTPAYNLPSRYVIHTVGPIVNAQPTQRDRELLASCYTSCLDAAAEAGCSSIVFCCISTGVFGYPPKEAAQVAVETVRAWLDAHESDSVKSPMHVIFDVFGQKDEEIYHELLFD